MFKLVVALLDTLPFYAGVHWLAGYLQIDARAENAAAEEELLLDARGATRTTDSPRRA